MNKSINNNNTFLLVAPAPAAIELNVGGAGHQLAVVCEDGYTL